MVRFKIHEKIWESDDKYGEHIELNYMTWANGEPKFDIRKWAVDGTPYKGVTLTEDELREMYDALKEYFDDITEPDAPEPVEKESHVIDFRTFLIHSGDCVGKGHDLEDVVAVIFVSSPAGDVQEVCFRAKYCRTCKHYYITKEQYKDLKKKGTIMCQVLSAKQYEAYKQGITYGELKEESKLFMAGYSLRGGISKDQRRNILICCIENGWMTKNEIISHLSFLIRLNEGHNPNAAEIWREDRAFLCGYVNSGDRYVWVKCIVEGKPLVQR